MSFDVRLRADELAFGFADDAIDEGLMRSADEIELRRPREAQLWVSAAFELARRFKAKIGDTLI